MRVKREDMLLFCVCFMQTDSKTSYLFLLVELMEKYGKSELHESKKYLDIYLHTKVQHSGYFSFHLTLGVSGYFWSKLKLCFC